MLRVTNGKPVAATSAPTFEIKLSKAAQAKWNKVARAQSEKVRNSLKANSSSRPKSAPVPRAALGLPPFEELKREGEPERLLKEIKQNIAKASMAHREALDHEVARCVGIAQFLLSDVRHCARYFGGAFWKFYQKRADDPSQALRWVLKRVFKNQKQSSKIYNAIRVMFTDRVPAEDFPAQVRAAGGYGKLAATNARHRLGPESSGAGPNAATQPKGISPKPDAEPHPSAQGKTWQGENSNRPAEEPISVIYKLEIGTGELLALGLPCFAQLGAYLQADDDGQLSIRISSAKKDGRR
jgi:hypothetical protein